jgi:hypothetical protein
VFATVSAMQAASAFSGLISAFAIFGFRAANASS